LKEYDMNWTFSALYGATHLTPQESEILRLIASGCTYARAADRLGVSLNTIATHIKNTYRKLGVRSGAAAVMRAVELQVLG
jgi:LuxR family transcriptional regulator, maltose regulon positive regulatory protein